MTRFCLNVADLVMPSLPGLIEYAYSSGGTRGRLSWRPHRLQCRATGGRLRDRSSHHRRRPFSARSTMAVVRSDNAELLCHSVVPIGGVLSEFALKRHARKMPSKLMTRGSIPFIRSNHFNDLARQHHMS